MRLVEKDNILLLFLLLTVLGTVSQITIGGITRVTGSGDGCPDWPTCFGKWFPPLEYHALIEYSHRSMGTLVGLLILTIFIRVLLKHKYNKGLVKSSLSLSLLVIIVGLLGGFVVLSELNPAVRTIHLMLAEITILLSVTSLILFVDFNSPTNYSQSDTLQVKHPILSFLCYSTNSYAFRRGIQVLRMHLYASYRS